MNKLVVHVNRGVLGLQRVYYNLTVWKQKCQFLKNFKVLFEKYFYAPIFREKFIKFRIGISKDWA